MKFLKWLLIIVLVLVGLFVIFNATQESKLSIEESIVIDAPASQVYGEIIDFKGWDNWSAWNKLDSNMEQSYEGEMGQVGYKNSWKSNHPQVGNGSQEVVEVRKNEYMRAKMRFEGFEVDNFATFELAEEEGKTTVVWSFEGGETPFMMRFMNALIEPAIRESFKSSLKDLKEVVESKPAEVPNPMNLEVVDLEPTKIVSIKDSTTADGISNFLRDAYSELAVYMESQENAQIVGMPLGIYYFYSPEKVVMEAAFRYEGEAEESGRVKVWSLPEGKAIKGIHYGSYDASGDMHYAIEDYSKASGMTMKDMCWEIYANDPTMVDSAKVETHIYYPLQ